MNFVTNLASKRSYFNDLFLLALFFLVFYLLWIGNYPVFVPDEGRYSEVAREMVATGDFITPRVNGVAFLDKPVLYYWLQSIAIYFFGVKEWALRLFPALFGVLGCLLTYVAGRYVFDRRTGIVSAIILATTPLYFANAHYANLDLEVAVLISATLLFFLMGALTDKKRKLYFFISAYVFASLAFLTKGLIGIVFPGIIGLAWMVTVKRFDVLKKMSLLFGIFIFLALTLPWYILVQKANPEFLHFFFVTQQLNRFLSHESFNNPSPIWFYLPVVLIGFFPWSMFIVQAMVRAAKNLFIKMQTREMQAQLFLFIWALFVFIFFSIPSSKIVGYILPIFPSLALLVGHYLSVAWERVAKIKHRLTIALFVLLTIAMAGFLILAHVKQLIEISSHFETYLILMTATLLVSAVVAIASFRRRSFATFFAVCVLGNVVFLLTLVHGARHLNQNTAKPLISILQTKLAPNDEVVNYFKFYSDVPLYLGRRVTLVADWQAPDIASRDNWVRELWYGMPFQKTDDWLISEKVFWQRFNSKNRVFVFVNENYFDRFKQQAKRYYVVGKYNDIILVRNK